MNGLNGRGWLFVRALRMEERARRSSRKAALSILLGLGSLALAPMAEAKECKKTESVDSSAQSIEANKKAGGHVEKHIKGKPTEKGKSQFTDETSYKLAWSNWVGYTRDKPTPKTCGTSGSPMDCVPAVHLGIALAYKCTEIDSKDKCTEGHDFVPEAIAFRYLKENGKWILNTAYPSDHSSCE